MSDDKKTDNKTLDQRASEDIVLPDSFNAWANRAVDDLYANMFSNGPDRRRVEITVETAGKLGILYGKDYTWPGGGRGGFERLAQTLRKELNDLRKTHADFSTSKDITDWITTATDEVRTLVGDLVHTRRDNSTFDAKQKDVGHRVERLLHHAVGAGINWQANASRETLEAYAKLKAETLDWKNAFECVVRHDSNPNFDQWVHDSLDNFMSSFPHSERVPRRFLEGLLYLARFRGEVHNQERMGKSKISVVVPKTDLRFLQTNLPWSDNYSTDFRSDPRSHKHFAHAVGHIVKAAGVLTAQCEDWDHHRPNETNTEEKNILAHERALMTKALADVVISALRAANTMPFGAVDLAQATVSRIETKNNIILTDPNPAPSDAAPAAGFYVSTTGADASKQHVVGSTCPNGGPGTYARACPHEMHQHSKVRVTSQHRWDYRCKVDGCSCGHPVDHRHVSEMKVFADQELALMEAVIEAGRRQPDYALATSQALTKAIEELDKHRREKAKRG